MKKYFTLKAILIILSVFVFSCQQPIETKEGNATIFGEVLNLQAGVPIAKAEVELFYHQTKMLQEGLYIGEMSEDKASTKVYTDKAGIFKLPAIADTTGHPTYVWIRVSHPDFERMHEVFVYIQKGHNTFGAIEMRKPALFGKKVRQEKGRQMYKHATRSTKVFVHDISLLKQRYPMDSLMQLPSIKAFRPKGNYARYYDLKRGYNNHQIRRFKRKNWTPYTNIILPLDLAMAGVTEGEVGLFTDHPEALKTQVIWARTYALYKALHTRMPQNFQMAFNTSIADYTLQASLETTHTILTHPKVAGGLGSPLLSVFSSRCNGDFTQSGEMAKWSGCKLGGNRTPYLLAVECSNHPNCYQAGMTRTSCCNIAGSQRRYIFGHGAGGCQHGMRDYAEQGWPHTIIAPYFYYGSRLSQYEKDVWILPRPY